MKCPNDGSDLIRASHQGIVTERCPQCGGVWLGGESLAGLLKAARAEAKRDTAPKAQRFEDRADDSAAQSGRGQRFGGRFSRTGSQKTFLEQVFDPD